MRLAKTKDNLKRITIGFVESFTLFKRSSSAINRKNAAEMLYKEFFKGIFVGGNLLQFNNIRKELLEKGSLWKSDFDKLF